MKAIRIFAAVYGLMLLGHSALAQSDTFTQVGSLLCPIAGSPPNWLCPSVTFPIEFGGTPSVVVSFNRFIQVSGNAHVQAYVDVQPTSVKATGFQPVVSSSGGIGATTVGLSWTAVGPQLHNGTVVPKYLVLTVVYAPPGTNGGHSTSSVSYAAGSTTGTTTSASQSFKVANSLSFEGSGGILGNGGAGGLSFDWSHSATDSQSLDIKKSVTSTISRNGPSQDGINHDEDAIYLLLNPTINLALSSSSAAWLLTNTKSPIQYVYVGWLNGHVTMPTNIANVLKSAGITPAEYPNILARDPLANGSAALDPVRFVSVGTTFPYEPPYTSTDPVPTITTNITDSSLQTAGSATEDTYKIGLSYSQTGDYLEFAKETLKDAASWEWTYKSSVSTSTGTTQTASVTIGGPAFGYTGPTVMEVYTDTIYHTFAFAVVPVGSGEIGLKGTVLSSTGAPFASTEVTLVSDGIKRRTFTNSKGEYTFLRHLSGPATVEAAGVTQVVPQLDTARSVELRKH